MREQACIAYGSAGTPGLDYPGAPQPVCRHHNEARYLDVLLASVALSTLAEERLDRAAGTCIRECR